MITDKSGFIGQNTEFLKPNWGIIYRASIPTNLGPFVDVIVTLDDPVNLVPHDTHWIAAFYSMEQSRVSDTHFIEEGETTVLKNIPVLINPRGGGRTLIVVLSDVRKSVAYKPISTSIKIVRGGTGEATVKAEAEAQAEARTNIITKPLDSIAGVIKWAVIAYVAISVLPLVKKATA